MYTRKFIILRKDLGTITGRNPKGHGKLEVKGPRGFVSVTIENADEQNVYNVVFISKEKSSPILNLGKIFTDDVGRGKGDYSFMLKDVLLDSIRGILVMKDREILLGGYIDKEDGTIERYIETIFEISNVQEDEVVEELPQDNREPFIEEFLMDSEDEVEQEPEPEVEVELELEPEPEMEPEVEPEPEMEPEVEPEPELELELEYIPEETIFEESECKESTTEEIVTEEEVCEEVDWKEAISQEFKIESKVDDVEDLTSEETIQDLDLEEEDMEPDYNTIDHIKKLNQKNQTTNYVLSILRFFPYVDPFKYNIQGYNWWKVELDKENEYSSFLPYFSYLTGGNNKEPYESDVATCNKLMDKYQHYLFGLYNENEQVKYFVYGVPGKFIKSEHPNKGSNGFNTWYQGVGAEGYWIIYIDPMTGKQVIPFNTMNPID